MYIIEIKDTPLNWIAAVFENEADGRSYLEEIEAVHGENAALKAISPDKFPVYAIEHVEKNSEGKDRNYFEFINEQEYLKLIAELKSVNCEDDWKVYFTAYIFEENYFQRPNEKSFMGALDHVHVDKYFLQNESSEKGLAEGKISRFAAGWNIDGLNGLFEKYIETGSEAEKEELAVDGYISLFCTMDYDFACGKLTDKGTELLLPIAEKASLLMGKKLWDLYSRAYLILLENAIDNHSERVEEYFQEAKKAIHENIKSSPEDFQESYYQLAYAYNLMAEHHHFHGGYWQNAIESIQQSIAIAPKEGNWYFYLSLLYVPYQLRKTRKIRKLASADEQALYQQWETLRKKAVEEFKNHVFSLKNDKPSVALRIALAFQRLKEQLDWHKADVAVFPEDDYQFWINEAQKVEGHETTRIDLTEETHFLHKEGKRLERIDLIESAIRHFERLIEKVEAPAFEVYYKASALEDIALLYRKNNEAAKVEQYLNEAISLYESHIDLVKCNPSVFMHYVEFMERCFLSKENIRKLSLTELKDLMVLVEEESEGMYSGPALMRMRLALVEQKEDEAIFHLSKLLLLHELCMEEEFKNLRDKLENTPFIRLHKFVDDTIKFMAEVREGYYLDPAIRWKQLKQMNMQEIGDAWEARKTVIKARKKQGPACENV